MHAEGAAACVAAVDRTGAAALRALSAQARRQAELVEHARDRQLPLDVREVHGAALARRGHFGYVVGASRGDHWLCRLDRRVARGLPFGCRATFPPAIDVARGVPGVVVGVERPAGFPDGPDQVQEL